MNKIVVYILLFLWVSCDSLPDLDEPSCYPIFKGKKWGIVDLNTSEILIDYYYDYLIYVRENEFYGAKDNTVDYLYVASDKKIHRREYLGEKQYIEGSSLIVLPKELCEGKENSFHFHHSCAASKKGFPAKNQIETKEDNFQRISDFIGGYALAQDSIEVGYINREGQFVFLLSKNKDLLTPYIGLPPPQYHHDSIQSINTFNIDFIFRSFSSITCGEVQLMNKLSFLHARYYREKKRSKTQEKNYK